MSNYINEDIDYFDGFDFENAKPIKHPLIAKAQAEVKAQMSAVEQLDGVDQENLKTDFKDYFDDDVQKIVIEHDNPQDRMRLNAIIRALYATS